MTIDIKFIRSLPRIRKRLTTGTMSVDDVVAMKDDFSKLAYFIIDQDRDKGKIDDELVGILKDFLMICLDVYTYSDNGDVLIPDYTYDQVMGIYCDAAKCERLAYADYISSSTIWPFVKHEAPFMVGTISRKVYDLDTLEMYLDEFQRDGYERILYAPKFDGVSTAVTKKNGTIVRAVTRNNGYEGQDITEVIKRMNRKKKIFDKLPDGYYKCEVVMSTKDFDELCTIKPYANRRSASSACISAPSNLPFAEYLTAIPLAWVNFEGTEMKYLASQYAEGLVENPSDFSLANVYENITRILHHIRTSDYPIRTDGVVLFPIYGPRDAPNTTDLMANCVAYKVNTQEAITRADYAYMSIGRTGMAKPMLHVEPVEVNETIVKDISLGSFRIFSSMNLHKDEEVIVYSAGDVIPQVRMPDIRSYPKGAPRLEMDIRCPHCGKKLKAKDEKEVDLFCMNPRCPRVLSGRIAAFLEKLDLAEGFRDRTFYALVEAKIVYTIEDLFTLQKRYEDVAKALHSNLEAEQLIEALKELKNKKFEVSQVLGAVGIEGIGQKTCQNIFSEISLDELLDLKKNQIIRQLMNIHGVGYETATTLGEWIDENRDFIETLDENMQIVNDSLKYATICFTGFRNKEYQDRFKQLGFPVTDSVTNQTIACVYAGDATTGNAKKAYARYIPLVHSALLDKLQEVLEEETKRLEEPHTMFSRTNLMRTIQNQVVNAHIVK